MKIRMLSLVCIILVTLFIVPSAYAFFCRGSDLVKYMKECEKRNYSTEYSVFECGLYMGFNVGVYDATDHIYRGEENITRGQINKIVMIYLKAHPERWNEPAVDLVMDALKEAFPLNQ